MIQLKAQQLGRTLDDATAQRLAMQTLTENGSWDDQRLSQLLTNNTTLCTAATTARRWAPRPTTPTT
jgi:hypothetical protein